MMKYFSTELCEELSIFSGEFLRTLYIVHCTLYIDCTLYLSRKVVTKNVFRPKIFPAVDTGIIFHDSSFSGVDTRDIFYSFPFSEVNTVS